MLSRKKFRFGSPYNAVLILGYWGSAWVSGSARAGKFSGIAFEKLRGRVAGRRGVHFAGFKAVRLRNKLGVDVKIQHSLDLLLPENAAFFEPCQYIRRNFKLFARLRCVIER